MDEVGRETDQHLEWITGEQSGLDTLVNENRTIPMNDILEGLEWMQAGMRRLSYCGVHWFGMYAQKQSHRFQSSELVTLTEP